MKRYFITGTDTDCGKTYVTCQLLGYFKQQNKKSIGLKPVASGCYEDDGQLISGDALQLQGHNPNPTQDICGWHFKPPISPHLAAAEAGMLLSAELIAEFCNDPIFADYDYQLIEGAGGLMVPINTNQTWLDFLALMKIPVILVVGMRLGCLNHALLTESALITHNIPCAGWVANCLDNNMLALNENIDTLSAKLKAPLLAVIPYEGTIYSLSRPS